jgi:pyrimidine-nucleoside phosphorylase
VSLADFSQNFRAIDVIRKKRDGVELSRGEIESLVNAYTHDQIPDYQVSAWLMAVVLRGMTRAETAALTEAMLHSGEVLDLSSLSAKKVDKHSTGGVGDKTSLVLAPVVAAAGLAVPMISGRGLGHTGGTLDKLEAIPGFNVNLSVSRFRQVLEKCGCCMIGQTAEIAPADRKLYALRDVTGTVESPYLICASIMSKKLAEGIDALVLDVKTGSGAFMKSEKEAAFLAELMVETGERMGKKMVALITDMDQPLGNMIGNALEVVEVVEVLRGGGPEDLRSLCHELAGWMLHLGGAAATVAEGRQQSAELISSGKALEKFSQMVEMQGGDPHVIDDVRRLPQARYSLEVTSAKPGYLASMQCERLGTASAALSRGLNRAPSDFATGLILRKKVGDHIAAGDSLCTIRYNSEEDAACYRKLVEDSYQIADTPPRGRGPLVRRIIRNLAEARGSGDY